MRLVIVRHGRAEGRRPGVSDEERRLTNEGRRNVECIARVLPWRIELVYGSPLKRAVETAEILSTIHSAELRVVNELRPETTLLNVITQLELRSVTALVEHAPSIEQVLQELISGGNVKLSAGAAAGMEFEVIERGRGC
uniref:Phosphohistidine phosphatase SixA n=1 Tax=Ignisphaera aggregans TaxID=334771 RepID=A0A7J3Z542_9CREN